VSRHRLKIVAVVAVSLIATGCHIESWAEYAAAHHCVATGETERHPHFVGVKPPAVEWRDEAVFMCDGERTLH
jgi:hypothetical protein